MYFKAYFEEWSVKPGDTVKMAVSTPFKDVRANLEKTLSGPGDKHERKLLTRDCSDILNVSFCGKEYDTMIGSWGVLPLSDVSFQDFQLSFSFWPTLTSLSDPKTILSITSGEHTLAIKINERGLHLFSDHEGMIASIEKHITEKRWYQVELSVIHDTVSLTLNQYDGFTLDSGLSCRAPFQPQGAPSAIYLATMPAKNGVPSEVYSGKIGNPRFTDGRTGQVIAWEFAGNWNSETVEVATHNAQPGRLYNGVERAVTSHLWDGTTELFHQQPDMYAALQFHDDAVCDSGWPYDLVFTLPADIESGIYVVKLEAEDEVDYYPLFVQAAATASAQALLLVPTNTYLAYGNDHLAGFDFSKTIAHDILVPDDEKALFTDVTFGRSLYDVHSDGTPVRYASRRRPIVNVRPKFYSWLNDSYRHLSLDMYLIEWLEKSGVSYHIATDEHLESDGRALLDRYDVVITGSHPEYWTGEALDVLQSYLSESGRLMYLGGNGFYWVTTKNPERPWIAEVRRDNNGTRCWDSPMGERSHSSTGELGGIWRARGKSPNKLTGVGFAAQGWGRAQPYKRSPESYHPSVSHFFDGTTGELFGEEGYVLNGAAGDEVDRFDISLGSPAHACVLASSLPLGKEYQFVIEEQVLTMPDQDGVNLPDKVKADMVYFEINGGGKVFSIGSIVYAGAMAWNNFDNDLARLTTNVLKDFAK